MRFQPSPEVGRIQEILNGLQKGERITYWELSHRIGSDVRTRSKSALRTARDRLIGFGVKFRCVELSLERLDDHGVIEAGQLNLRFIQRKSKRTFHETTQCVESYGTLSNEDKQHFDVTVAVAGVIAHALQPKVLERLTPVIQHETQNQRTLMETMDALKNLITS